MRRDHRVFTEKLRCVGPCCRRTEYLVAVLSAAGICGRPTHKSLINIFSAGPRGTCMTAQQLRVWQACKVWKARNVRSDLLNVPYYFNLAECSIAALTSAQRTYDCNEVLVAILFGTFPVLHGSLHNVAEMYWVDICTLEDLSLLHVYLKRPKGFTTAPLLR